MRRPAISMSFLVNVISISTAIIIYFVQSPNQSTTTNIIVLSPLVFLILFNTVHLTYRNILLRFNGLASLQNYYKQYKKYKCDSYLTYRILNNEGDADYFCLNKIKINGNNYIMYESVGELIYSKEELADCPPLPKIVFSNVINLKMKILKIEKPDIIINGVTHKTCAWKYEFIPPLRKNDVVEYEFYVKTYGLENEAFSSKGTPLFLDCIQDATSIDYTMIAPNGYKFNILDQYVELSSKIKKSINALDRGYLYASKQVFHWKPRYSSNKKYVSIYQLSRR